MKDDDCDDLGGPRASDEFRKRVLEVLEKPYDQEEYTTHRKAFRSGNYFNHYPGQLNIFMTFYLQFSVN